LDYYARAFLIGQTFSSPQNRPNALELMRILPREINLRRIKRSGKENLAILTNKMGNQENSSL
jgi:hypothetical protein